MTSLVSLSAPGDLLGTIAAVANAIGSIADAIKAVAEDQSAEGRIAAAALNIAFAGPVAILDKLNHKLGLEPVPPQPVKAVLGPTS